MKGFKKIAPGVLVNEKVKVSIPHPDLCWIIQDKKETSTLADNRNNLLIFSEKKKAEDFAKEYDTLKKFSFKKYPWNELVDRFDKTFINVIVNIEAKAGHYAMVPLCKDVFDMPGFSSLINPHQ
ncbi:MAG: hypothetical protein WC795_02685 [Candidatus Paceibacterota bacterium]|jgi:hypothetical protein